MYYIVIRESQLNDTHSIAELVRKAYTANVQKTFIAALFNEVTFQAIIVMAAFMFIFMGVPIQYCILSVPIVLLLMYVLIYGAILMKAAELVHGKRAMQCWVAEAYEPYFFTSKPEDTTYQIVAQDEFKDFNIQNQRKTIVGTCAVVPHKLSSDWLWLFRLAVDPRYQRKKIGLKLTQTAQNWTKTNRYGYLEAVTTECQEEARQVFGNAGFVMTQCYHKRLFTSLVSLQMFQLRSEVRFTFK